MSKYQFITLLHFDTITDGKLLYSSSQSNTVFKEDIPDHVLDFVLPRYTVYRLSMVIFSAEFIVSSTHVCIYSN